MRYTSRLVTGMLLAVACKKTPPPPEMAAAPAEESAPAAAPIDFSEDPELNGLKMRLYEASAADAGMDRAPLGASTPLSDADLKALLGRIPALDGTGGDAVAFALRDGPQPPPRAGATVTEAFPPDQGGPAAPIVESGPITVQRASPKGAVPMAPELNVTFSQPMIALSSQDDASKSQPVVLEPQPPGRWRWLGTRTVQFQPEGRFPMATRYVVKVEAGTKGASGGAVEKAESWTFETPPVTLQSYWPYEDGGWRRGVAGNPQPADPLIFLGFDQRIDADAILSKLLVSGGGVKPSLRLATAEEIAAKPEIAAMVKAAEPGRALVVRPTAALPLATTYTVTVPVGTPSAEGPLLTSKAASFVLRTYGPFSALSLGCWDQHPCPPTSPWAIDLTNPVDPERFDPALVHVSPEVPGLQITPSGSQISLYGAFAPRTTYTVAVDAGLTDIFGQHLTKAASFTINVGPADKSFSGPPNTFVITDPSAPPAVSFFTVNHRSLKVTVQRVSPEDWNAWVDWQQKFRWEDRNAGPLPGQNLASKVVQVKGTGDEMAETRIELAPYLKGSSGSFIVRVEPTNQPANRWERTDWIGWVQVSPLGLTAFSDTNELTGWVSSLTDGAPVEGATLDLIGAHATPVPTGKDGLGKLTLTNELGAVLVARRGDDVAMLPNDVYGWGRSGWVQVNQLEQLRWYVFDDKHLYKPGETVHVRGWVRRMPPGKGADLQALDGRLKTLTWAATSSEGNPMGEGTVKVSENGGFELELPIPATPNLGTANIVLRSPDDSYAWYQHNFELQEYRTPEFEVSTSGGDGVYALGEDAFIDVSAAYYAGGALPSAPVTWTVTATPGSFTPPGRSDWSFGPWAPWWAWWSEPSGIYNQETMSSSTDASGLAHLGVHFEALNPAQPMTVTAEATVMDVNRQAWSSSKSFLVHPAAWYVGLRTTKPFVEAGEPLEVSTLVVDREGKEVSGAEVSVELQRLSWKATASGWREVPDVLEKATVGPAAAGKVTFTPAAGGSYAIVAVVKDASGRKSRTEHRVWVAGDAVEPDRGVAQEQVTIVPDKQSYAVGDTAIIGVQAPFAPAEGVLTLRAGGLLETRRFTLTGTTTTLEVPITEAHIPDLTVAVDLVGARTRSGDDGNPREDLAKRPAFASGTVALKVPPLTRTLAVSVTPAVARLDPGAGTTIQVEVKDPQGKPVSGAELAVVAVDEAVLSLTGYRLPDPLDAFYVARGDSVRVDHLRQWLQLGNVNSVGLGGLGAAGMGKGGGGVAGGMVGDLQAATGASAAPGAMPPEPMMELARADAPVSRSTTVEAKKSAEKSSTKDKEAFNADDAPTPDASATPIAVRSNFSALALWAPSVKTDAAGKATVELKLPDNLTRYRVMVVAISGARTFGSGDADVTARLPLMVRPSAPRFLNFGDRLELPVVVQNQTDAPMVVDIALRASNLSLLSAVTDALPVGSASAGGVTGRRVTVPANDRVEVRFPAAAAMAGKARVQLAVASGKYADAADVSLPVWTPATTEAFATYGTFEPGAVVQPVAPPTDVWSQFGGLEVTLSTTQLQALTDAFVYLIQYPYDCNEQIASRVLAVAALRDVLSAFGSNALPKDNELKEIIAADLDRLKRRQNPDGGFAFWRRGDESWPYLTIHVAHAIVMAEAKGYAVDAGMKASALRYLDIIERHIPSWYSKESKWYLRGYALNVLSLSGRDQVGKAKALLAEAGVDKLPPEAKGWILPILVSGKATKEAASLTSWLGNHLTETAAGAHLVTSYSDGAYVLLHSDRGVDGIWLEALLRTDPKNELIPKLVNGLLAHQKAGRWESTTENAFILLALDRYFRAYESVTPDLVARVWLGTGFAGDHTFKGYSTERAEIDVPMAWLKEKGKTDLTIGSTGKGRLYYRAGLSYAPLNLDPPAVDNGFTVLRTYEAVDAPGDVTRDKDGVWHVKAGARVRVKLTMVAPARRYHVALVDPLPAGLEVLNPELKGSGAVPPDPSAEKSPYWWWTRTWYEHENLRDDRVEAFASLLWDGVHAYTYVARATTPGIYVVPPSKAEEMYSPETFGRSDGDNMVVE